MLELAKQSTLSAFLAATLGVKHIPLDTLFWDPNWKQTPADEFRGRVSEALSTAPKNGWVVDGNFDVMSIQMIDDAATDIICECGCGLCLGVYALTCILTPGLDPPFALYFSRIVLRTFGRLLGWEEPCADGCQETIREVFFSKESILLYCITQHRKIQKRWQDRQGTVLGEKMRRIGGWGGELAQWTADVEKMAREL